MKKNMFFKVTVICIFFLPCLNRVNAQAARDFSVTAYNFYKNKQYDSALSNVNKSIRVNPNYGYAYQLRGNIYFSKKTYDLALQDYNKALILEPNNPTNCFNRGNVYNAKKIWDSAIQDFNHSISLKPNNPSAYHGRGIAHSNRKEYDAAIQDFNSAILLDSIFFLSYNARGLAYIFKGEYDLAVNDFKKAIVLDVNKERPYVIINIIEPMARLYRFTEAAGYFSDFRAKYTTGYIDSPYWLFFKKYMEVVTQNLTKNDYATALANLTEAEKLYSTKNKAEGDDDSQRRGFSSILALKGYVLEQMNNNEEAKHAYEQAILINPLEPDVASALQRLSQKKEALVLTDNTPPTINILEPALNNRSISVEDDKVAGAKQHIRGQAIDPSGIKSVMLNNVPLKIEENGYFDTVVNINDGINIFTIVATDKHANSVSGNIQIVTGKDKTRSGVADKPADSVLSYNPVYHAILIAESDYADKNIPSLQGPTSDMLKIYNLLVNNYVFAPENTDTLVNATRANILETIIKKANAMSENDNLFVFYAGHGQMITQPDQSEEGFLVPQDAVKGELSSYISSEDLLRTIKYSKAKHILFVADACFAGSLFRDIPTDAPAPVTEAYKDKSRKLLASGNRTAVPDRSEFIEYLRLALQENRQHYITAEQLIDSFKNQYTSTTHLQLQYYPIKNVDDLGGQFVFIRK
jgi:tetratricopeptide (TPR) repeat protein